jgi:hypothetical protein
MTLGAPMMRSSEKGNLAMTDTPIGAYVARYWREHWLMHSPGPDSSGCPACRLDYAQANHRAQMRAWAQEPLRSPYRK